MVGPDAQFVIPHAQFVIPDAQFVIPDAQFVIPDLIRDPVSREPWIAGQARNDKAGRNDNLVLTLLQWCGEFCNPHEAAAPSTAFTVAAAAGRRIR